MPTLTLTIDEPTARRFLLRQAAHLGECLSDGRRFKEASVIGMQRLVEGLSWDDGEVSATLADAVALAERLLWGVTATDLRRIKHLREEVRAGMIDIIERLSP